MKQRTNTCVDHYAYHVVLRRIYGCKGETLCAPDADVDGTSPSGQERYVKHLIHTLMHCTWKKEIGKFAYGKKERKHRHYKTSAAVDLCRNRASLQPLDEGYKKTTGISYRNVQ